MRRLVETLFGIFLFAACATGDKLVPESFSTAQGEPPPERVRAPEIGRDLWYRIHVAVGQYWLTHRDFDRAAGSFNAAILLEPNRAEALKGLNLAVASRDPKTVFPVTEEDTSSLAAKLLFLAAQAKKRDEWALAIEYAKPVAFGMPFPIEHLEKQETAKAMMIESAEALLQASAGRRESYCASFQFKWPSEAYEEVEGCKEAFRRTASEPEASSPSGDINMP